MAMPRSTNIPHSPLALLILGLALWSPVSGAQHGVEPSASPDPVGIPSELLFEESTQVAWVMVPTVVRGDGAEQPLEVSDFRITIDDEPIEPVDFFSGFDESSTLLLFQDLSGSMANGGKLETSQRIVRCLTGAARPGDEMAVVSFASGSTLVDVPITSELGVIDEVADSWQPYGTTALHDAVTWIPQVRLGARSRAAAVLITDGVDNASVLTADAARTMVLGAEVPVYVLALRTRRELRRSAKAAAQVQAEPDQDFAHYGRVLRQLAEATGGRYVEISRPEQADAACATVTRDLKSRYLLSFPLSTDGSEAERAISVSIPDRPLSVRHRASYVGRPPA